MKPTHEDLVGYALGALETDEMERVRVALLGSEAEATEAASALEEVRRHLALHDALPSLEPSPSLWRDLESRLAEPPPPNFAARWWRPLVAAGLILAALFAPRPHDRPSPEVLHGRLSPRPGEPAVWESMGVSRAAVGTGVVVTLDDAAAIEPLGPNRLALRAGRVFFEVGASQRGFVVEACGEEVVTTGTAFTVDVTRDRLKVVVEEGHVRCGGLTVGPGEAFGGGRVIAYGQPVRDWFTRPVLTARILDERTVLVVFRSEMPDPILLAPPTGGGPFCYLSYGGHDYPANPEGFDAATTLEPGSERSFELRLPDPLPDGEALFVAHPRTRVRVEATR